MENGFRSRLALLMSVLIIVSASSFAIVEEWGGGPQSLNASPDASTAVTLSDGFTLSTTGSWTTGGYTIVVIVPNNGGSPYKDYTISFTGTSIAAPASPSHGTFTVNSGEVESGTGSELKTLTYAANSGATRVQIGTDLSGITYSGAGTVTITVTDGGASSASATHDYVEDSIGNNVYVSTIGGGPKHYTSLSDAYNNASGTDSTIRLLTDISQNTTLAISNSLTITSDSSSQVCSIKHSSTSGTTILNVTNGAIVLKNITIDGNKQGSGFLVTVGSTTSTPSLTLDSGATVKNGAKGGILLGVAGTNNSRGTLNIESGAVIEGNAGSDSYYVNASTTTTTTGAIGVIGNTTFMMGGGEIRGNSGGWAGGINFCYNSGGSAQINGGSITGNTASSGAGAILIDTNGRLELNGGTITGNKSNTSCGAVEVYDTSDQYFSIGGFTDGSGTPLVITDNLSNGVKKNLYLKDNKVVGRATNKVLATGSAIGVTVQTPPSSAGGYVTIVNSSAGAEEAYFKSDAQLKAGIVRDTGGAIKLTYDSRGLEDVYVSSSGNDATGDGSIDKPFKTLSTAYSNVKTGGTIYLMTDIEMSSVISMSGKNITITSNTDNVRTITRTSNTNLMSITSGTITLEKVKLTDKSGLSPLKALVRVGENANSGKVAGLVLGNGASIEDITMNSSTNTDTQWGIVVIAKTGTFTMNDGSSVEDCKGGSGPIRCTDGGGLFVMNGGSITGCDSWYIEGTTVYIASGSTMQMNGGSITNCGTAGSDKSGTIYLHNGTTNTFIMTGGEIKDNTAKLGGGVYSAQSGNVINISGTAVIDDNIGLSFGTNAESNVYLASGQTITIGGSMSGGASVGVYTADTPTQGHNVVFATGASDGVKGYFHSDKAVSAGVGYDASTNKLYLTVDSTAGMMNLGEAPVGVDVSGGALEQNPGTSAAITAVVLKSSAGYAALEEKHRKAIEDALSGSGLTVSLSNGEITISGTLNADHAVIIDLKTVLSGDNAPVLAAVTLTKGGNVTSYSSISDALSDADGGATVTIQAIPAGFVGTDNSVLKQGVSLVTLDGATFKPEGGDATISVDDKGNVTLLGGKIAANGKDSGNAMIDVVAVQSGGSEFAIKGESYTVQTSTDCAKLTVGDNAATVDNGASFANGTFDLKKDGQGSAEKTIVKDGGDGSSFTGTVSGTRGGEIEAIRLVDQSTTVVVASDGTITLVSGKGASGEAGGQMTAEISGSSKTFSSNGKYTVDASDGSLTINGGSGSDVSVEMGEVTFTGKADAKFALTDDTATIPSGASIVGEDSGLAIQGSGSGSDAAKVRISDDGSLTLIEGVAKVTGRATVPVEFGGGTTSISVPDGQTYTIDASQGKVSGIAADGTLTIQDVEFTKSSSGTWEMGFTSEGYGILEDGCTATIGAGKTGTVAIGTASDQKVTVPAGEASLAGKVTMAGASDGAIVTLEKAGDTFKVGDETYTAGSDGSKFKVSNDGSVSMIEGKMTLNKGDSIASCSGKDISNESDSSGTKITVEKRVGNPDKITVPSGGKVKIGDLVFEANDSEQIELTVDSSGNIRLVNGKIKLDDGTEISAGSSSEVLLNGTVTLDDGESVTGLNGKTIENPEGSSSDQIEVVSDWKDETNEVTIPDGGVVKIEGAQYVSAQVGTKIHIDSSGMTLTEGAVKIPKDKEISVGESETVVKGLSGGDGKEVTVTAEEGGSANVSIPAGGKAKVGEKEISSGSSNSITVDVDGSGSLSVTMSSGDKVDIGDAGYEATEADTKILIGDEVNTLESGAVKIDQGDSITIKDGPVVTNEGTGDVTVSIKEEGSAVEISEGGEADIGGSKVSAGTGSQVTVDISEEGNLEVEIPSGNKATIGTTEYEAAAEGTKILIDENENVLESGAVKVGENVEISVGDSKTVVKGLTDEDAKKVTVTAGDNGSGSVSFPAGGKAEIGGTSIEATGTGITAEVGKDGKTSITIAPGNSVKIGDTTYEGGSSEGRKVIVDPDGTVTVFDARKIEFDTGTGDSFDMDCGAGETIALPDGKTGHVIEKEGSVLVGWMSDDGQGGTKDYGLGFDYTVSENETLKAIWVEDEDVVVYRTDDGGSIDGSTYEVLDNGIASLDSTVKKEGYAFIGWKADSGDKTVAYASGLTVKASGTTYMTAYLVPESDLSSLCTVNYDSGYSAGIAFKQYVEQDVYVSLPTARDMHRDGYTFLGWEVAGTSTAAIAVTLGAEMGDRVSGTYLVSEDVTFTAVWAADGSDEKPWWDDDDPYIPYRPDTVGSSDGSMDTILIVVVASVAVLLLQLMILSSRRRS